MRFDLVCMPWLRADFPSMAISRLRSVLTAAGHEGDDHYVNLSWIAALIERFGVEGGDLYTALVDGSARLDVGSWIFGAGYWEGRGVADPALDAYLACVGDDGLDPDVIAGLAAWAPVFCGEQAERIVGRRPDVVGFTTTFQQTYPSLLLARAVKALDPDVLIVFGGANCDDEMGPALVDVFPEVDIAVTGEAEHVVVELAAWVAAGRAGPPARVAGVHWREGGVMRSSTAARRAVVLDELPMPDSAAFFDQFDSLGLAASLPAPGVVVETSRGCWWGERKHCTFCGLNGATMAFRSHAGSAATAQLVDGVTRHRAANVVAVDNIMDRSYFDTVLPELAALDADLSIFYEVRADLSAEDARALRAAGVRAVQPGIESLSTGALRRMRKSSTGSKHVQVLRDLHTEEITVDWNWLYGFPGEAWDTDYATVVAQMPNLVHLSPPSATRIDLQRFSPNFSDPSFGFRPYGPPENWRHVHRGLSEEQVLRIAYRFATAPQGLTDGDAVALHTEAVAWQECAPVSSLEWRPAGEGRVVIRDRRSNRPAADHLLDGAEALVHDLLAVPQSVASLGRALADRGHGGADLDAVLRGLFDAGLVFTDGATWVHVATAGRRPLPPAARPRPARRRIPVLERAAI